MQDLRYLYHSKALLELNTSPFSVSESDLQNSRNSCLKFLFVFAILDMSLSFQHSRVAYRSKALFILDRNSCLKLLYIFAILALNLSFQHSRVAYRSKALFILDRNSLSVLESDA